VFPESPPACSSSKRREGEPEEKRGGERETSANGFLRPCPATHQKRKGKGERKRGGPGMPPAALPAVPAQGAKKGREKTFKKRNSPQITKDKRKGGRRRFLPIVLPHHRQEKEEKKSRGGGKMVKVPISPRYFVVSWSQKEKRELEKRTRRRPATFAIYGGKKKTRKKGGGKRRCGPGVSLQVGRARLKERKKEKKHKKRLRPAFLYESLAPKRGKKKGKKGEKKSVHSLTAGGEKGERARVHMYFLPPEPRRGEEKEKRGKRGKRQFTRRWNRRRGARKRKGGGTKRKGSFFRLGRPTRNSGKGEEKKEKSRRKTKEQRLPSYASCFI